MSAKLKQSSNSGGQKKKVTHTKKQVGSSLKITKTRIEDMPGYQKGLDLLAYFCGQRPSTPEEKHFEDLFNQSFDNLLEQKQKEADQAKVTANSKAFTKKRLIKFLNNHKQ